MENFKQNNSERGTLKIGEPHPAAFSAAAWIRTLPMNKLFQYQESFCSCAIEGNRLAEICAETLRRFIAGEPVSDRYLVSLAWTLREMENNDNV